MDEAMTQFRAIPIEWILSTDLYHKFLMWVSARSTFNGWGRCDALQVTFTAREAAGVFSVSHTTVVRWVSKAKDAGLLMPTNNFDREQGKGEVYNLGGEMLTTVSKTPFQGRTKDAPTTHQVGDSESSTYKQVCSKDAPRAHQGRTVNGSTPDTPDTPKKRKAAVAAAPVEFKPFLEEIVSSWPKQTAYRDGSGKYAPARTTRLGTADHLWERMVRFCPGEDPKTLVNCALLYLEQVKEQPRVLNGLVPNVCAMTNFFGEKQLWKKYVADLMEEEDGNV